MKNTYKTKRELRRELEDLKKRHDKLIDARDWTEKRLRDVMLVYGVTDNYPKKFVGSFSSLRPDTDLFLRDAEKIVNQYSTAGSKERMGVKRNG